MLSQRIGDSQTELSAMADRLMRLGDETTARLGAITRELGAGSERLAQHASVLDRAAEAARNDIAVLLDDLPRAEQHARPWPSSCAAPARRRPAAPPNSSSRSRRSPSAPAKPTRWSAAAAQRLVAHLTQIESAGAAAAARVGEAESSFSTALDSLLDRTAGTLDEIRGGIDAQSAAVTALVEQASAGFGRAGVEAAETLGSQHQRGEQRARDLSARVAEQERASQRMSPRSTAR